MSFSRTGSSVGKGIIGGMIGRGGGIRRVSVRMPPEAARLSAARGPAAAKGEIVEADPHHRKNTSRCTITDPKKPLRQSLRSAERLSVLLNRKEESGVNSEIVLLLNEACARILVLSLGSLGFAC